MIDPEKALLKESEKQKKRMRLERNRLQGKLGEVDIQGELIANGWKVERKPHGQDFEATKGNETIKVEVKTGKAELSKLQKETQEKSKENYKEIRSIVDV